MITIRINTTGDTTSDLYFNDAWFDYVTENLTEKVVITGNRDFEQITAASWWTKAKEIITDLDCYGNEAMKYYRDDLTRTQRKAIITAYDNCYCSDNTDFIINIIKILFPEMALNTAEIKGYNQGEWQEVIYIDNSVNIELLEGYYFGHIADITINTAGDICGDYITDSELWEMERDGIEQALRTRYDIPEEEKITVLKCSGYTQIEQWERIA